MGIGLFELPIQEIGEGGVMRLHLFFYERRENWAMMQVPIGVSGRHIHLSPQHIDVLFGAGYQLKVHKFLSQPRLFAAAETLAVEGPRGRIERIRVIGPTRGMTQVEISRTDAYALGFHPPLRQSGDLKGTPGALLIGPAGVIQLEQGVIVAARHIHFHTSEAERWGIRNRQLLSVQVNGERPLVFHDVLARVSAHYALDMHTDTDEANAAGVITGDTAEIIQR